MNFKTFLALSSYIFLYFLFSNLISPSIILATECSSFVSAAEITINPSSVNSCRTTTITIIDPGSFVDGDQFTIWHGNPNLGSGNKNFGTITIIAGGGTKIINLDVDGNFGIALWDTDTAPQIDVCSSAKSLVVTNCATPTATPTPIPGCTAINGGCTDPSECCSLVCDIPPGGSIPVCLNAPVPPSPTPTPTTPPFNPCDGVEEENDCWSCIQDGVHAYTALGCIPTGPGPFAAKIIGIIFGLGGGVAFLLIVYGAFICITSHGDLQKVQACRETIISAIIGLLMLIFSLFILRIIFGPSGIFTGLIPSNIFY